MRLYSHTVCECARVCALPLLVTTITFVLHLVIFAFFGSLNSSQSNSGKWFGMCHLQRLLFIRGVLSRFTATAAAATAAIVVVVFQTELEN